MSKPDKIAIDHDDYHASHVGTLVDGRQFFLTTPFIPAINRNTGREFIVRYIFNEHGEFLEAQIDDMGTRAKFDEQRAHDVFQKRLTELGAVRFGRIEVRPFHIERMGVKFGLVLRSPEDDDGDWWVELQPGNYMAFHEPWDSGEYDT